MDMNTVSSFSERLKNAIGDMTSSELASKIGMSKQAISTYMTGLRSPKLPVIQALANALNVNEAWLIGYDVPMERLEFDTYVAAKDISDYVKSMSNDDLQELMSSFFTPDEIRLINDYKELNKQGKEYMRQTMQMAKSTYKKDNFFTNLEVG